MVSYNWACQVCDHTVSKDEDICPNCGCPANASSRNIEKLKIERGTLKIETINRIVPVWLVYLTMVTALILGWLSFEYSTPAINTMFKIMLPIAVILSFIESWAVWKHLNKRFFG